MLGFFLDQAMTSPITSATPKKFLVPLKGGTKTTTVYFGDPYSTVLSASAVSGATQLSVSDTTEFPQSGQASVGGHTVTYQSKSDTTLDYVAGLNAAVASGATVRPIKIWSSTSPIVLRVAGSDLSSVFVALAEDGGAFTYPGLPFVLSESQVQNGAAPLLINVKVTVSAGPLQQFSDWNISTSQIGAASPGSSPSSTQQFVLNGYVLRRDQQLPQKERILPLNRSLPTTFPGFVWGTYRWRNESQINRQAILASNWSLDPFAIGAEKFIAGVGTGDDLKPVSLTQVDESIYLRILRGHYFTGVNRYYLPATPQLDFLPSSSTTLLLTSTPSHVYPLYVGTYQLDSEGFYEKATEYRYQTSAAVTAGKNLPAKYYTLDRSARTITLNEPMSVQSLFLGAISGQSVDYFSLPVYPVGQVLQVYVQASSSAAPITVPNGTWSYDEDAGTLTITSVSGAGPSVVGSAKGMSVFATCTPAVAVLYETDFNNDELTIDSVDLNPAFAGISSGYVYLEHSKQQAASITLSCDKPRISVPATLASIVGLVAYGPVYFNGDYALLQAQTFSGVPNETVSGIRLKVVVDKSNFSGLINYQDPTTTDIFVTTGADGIANMVYTPVKNFGLYVPTTTSTSGSSGVKQTNVANDTVVLPEAVSISQLFDGTQWLVKLYTVLNTNPLYGSVNANTSNGEIPFKTSGTPGTPSYRMNGFLQPFLSTSNIIAPSQALDANGNNYTSPSFNGQVVSLVFPVSIPITGSVAGIFVNYLERVVISVEEVNSDVTSNSIMLQVVLQDVIDENVWLTLDDDTYGFLNQFRLGISQS